MGYNTMICVQKLTENCQLSLTHIKLKIVNTRTKVKTQERESDNSIKHPVIFCDAMHYASLKLKQN